MNRNVFLLVVLFLPFLAYTQENVVKTRLQMIESDVPLEYNEIVHSLIIESIVNDDRKTSDGLERFLYFEKTVDSVLNRYSLPNELKYLSFGLTNCATTSNYLGDRTGWYKMSEETAKKHGLSLNRYIDDRRDVIKSTVAFAKEMKELKSEYQDWKTALMVYLSSHEKWQEGKARGVMEYTYFTDYYKFVAATYVGYFYESHKIKPSAKLPLKTVKVAVTELTTLYQVSSSLGVDYQLLKELNGVYKREVVPANSPRMITIPALKLSEFKSKGEKIYEYASIPTYNATEVKFVGVSTPTTPVKRVEEAPSKDIEAETSVESITSDIIYHVRKGDVLVRIADFFDCTVAELKRWNNLQSDFLDIDQPLVIQVPTPQKPYYSRIDAMSKKERKALAALD